MDTIVALRRIFDSLDEDRVDRAVIGCLRLARHVKDHLAAAILLRELGYERDEVARSLGGEMTHLTPDAQAMIHDASEARWRELHTIARPSDGDARPLLLDIRASDIDAELARRAGEPADAAQPPAGDAEIAELRAVKARLRAWCLDYAIGVENELASRAGHRSLVEELQTEVDNFFKSRAQDVLAELHSTVRLASSPDFTDTARLLAELRRVLKAAADHFYPPAGSKAVCADGKQRDLGGDQYINRLYEFLATGLPQSDQGKLLRAELSHLVALFRRLDDMVLSDRRAGIALAASRQCVTETYFFLFNVCQHLTWRRPPERVAQQAHRDR